MSRGYAGSFPSLLERSYTIRESLDKLYWDIQYWYHDYLRQTYTLIFETTVPKGRTTGEQILNLAKIVFPELRVKYPRSLPSVEKRKTEGMTKSLSVDMAIKTVEGYFFIKDFKDKVAKEDDVDRLIQKIQDKHLPIFRIICVAKKYDKAFIQSVHRTSRELGSKEPALGVDLLIKEKVGYSVLDVS